ncbi:hypothetical protein [Rhizobium sp. BK068]|uniref:hypothetical protein n=1 Tax=Rhizobium sp. BK068 TaxID=2512130 RepID=UPI00104A2592|nr:hypothetical protein [Rhizobium sp. BK068]TCM71910.1 hypothetical protein EV291_12210 [Rhizobium sp. BK068]
MTAPAKNKPHKSATGLFGFHTIYGAEGHHDTPYITRAWFGRLRFHIFHRGDADPDCHDHPWDFWTFPLTPYVEEVVTPDGHGGFIRSVQVVRAFRLTYRPAEHCHRVLGRLSALAPKLPANWTAQISAPWEAYDHLTDNRKIITIVWRGGIGRRWGFLRHRDGRWCWTHWKHYVFEGGKDAPCIDPQELADASAIREYAADLAGMTLEQMEREFETVTEIIDRDTAWQEAHSAGIRAKKREAPAR